MLSQNVAGNMIITSSEQEHYFFKTPTGKNDRSAGCNKFEFKLRLCLNHTTASFPVGYRIFGSDSSWTSFNRTNEPFLQEVDAIIFNQTGCATLDVTKYAYSVGIDVEYFSWSIQAESIYEDATSSTFIFGNSSDDAPKLIVTCDNNNTYCSQSDICNKKGKCLEHNPGVQCSCYSGYCGDYCNQHGGCRNALDLSFVQPLVKQPIANYKNGNLTVTIELDVVKNRLDTGIAIGSYNIISIESICQYPNQFWTKTTIGCTDIFVYNAPWPLARKCGFVKISTEESDTYESIITILFKDSLNIPLSFQVKGTFQTTSQKSFPVALKFKKQVDITADFTYSGNFSEFYMYAAIIEQKSPQKFFGPSSNGSVTIKTRVDHPYSFKNPSLVQYPPRLMATLYDKTLEYGECENSGSSDCFSYYQIDINPLDECTLNGKYIISMDPDCRSNDVTLCDPSKLNDPINITAKLQSENFCSEFVVDVGLTAHIKSFSDANFIDESNGFVASGTIYFKATVESDTGNVAFSEVRIISLILVDDQNSSIQYPLVTDGAITTIGQDIRYQTYPGGVNWVGFSFDLNNTYTKPPKDSYSQFSVKVKLSVDYGQRKRSILPEATIANTETMIVFAAGPDLITELDYLKLAYLLGIGLAIIIVIIIIFGVTGKVIYEKVILRHAVAKNITSSLMKKFQSKGELQVASTLPNWIAPWEVPISNREIMKYERLLEQKKLEAQGRRNVKLDSLLTIAEWILARQKQWKAEEESSSSSPLF